MKNGEISFYEGEFVKGFKHGKGTFKNFKQRIEYEGGFYQGYFKGKGILRSLDKGYELEGKWDKGKLEGRGTKRWSDGRVMEAFMLTDS